MRQRHEAHRSSAPKSRTTEFTDLIEEYSRLISSAVRRVCGQAFTALIPDVQQEVHLAIWKVVEDGKKIEHPSSYLYKVALRTALATIRKHAPEVPTEDQHLDRARQKEHHDSRETELSRSEKAQLLEQALGELPEDQALAVRAYLRGLNHTEVAALFGCSESVARHRIYRGTAKLKKIMRTRG